MNPSLDNEKILFVISQLKVGGAAKMIKYVANLCAAHFKEVSLVTYYDDYTPEDVSSSIKRINLNVRISKTPLWRIKALIRLRKIVKQGGYFAVCSFLPDISAMSRLATIGLRLKVISAERGDPYQFSKLWKGIVTWTYRNSDYCFFQLEQARDFFDSKIKDHSYVIPNPYVPDLDVEPFFGHRKATIVSAGRFAWQKRFDVLIDAFAQVHKKHPNYRLILYGEGEYLQRYKKQAQALNIDRFVDFPGYIKNVSSFIREDGIFVLSSDYEGIPNSLIEAMSVGMPVVATDCTPGGAAFLTDCGKRGLLVPVHNVEAMSNAINTLIECPELSKNLSLKAVDVIRQLDIQVINKMWINAFTQILKK